MSVTIKKENYKSDLQIDVTFKLGGQTIPVPDNDFLLVFRSSGYRTYECKRIGDECINCRIDDGKVLCFLDNHKLQPGMISVEYYDYIPDVDFADGNQLKVVPTTLPIELITGPGDDAMKIDVDLAIDIISALQAVDAATINANEKAALANTAATNANNAATSATSAAATANQVASDANTAVTNAINRTNDAIDANIAATADANQAATNAFNAANMAIDATQGAITAANAANVASVRADESALGANTAATGATNAATIANNATTTANQAASNANVAAAEVESFIESIHIDDYYTKEEVDLMINAIPHGKSWMVVGELPRIGSSDYVYLIRVAASGQDVYDEYVWLGFSQRYEKIGSTRINLNDYYTKWEVDAKIDDAKFQCIVVDELPPLVQAQSNVMYFVPRQDASSPNIFDEFVILNNGEVVGYEQVGSTSVDLTDYYTKEETDTKLSEKYAKPSGGIPSTDLSENVQTSLGKADTALQEQVQSDWSQTDNTKVDFIKNKPTIPDISGKQDKRTAQNETIDASYAASFELNATKYHIVGEVEDITVTLPAGVTTVDEFLFTFTCKSANTDLHLPATADYGNGLDFDTDKAVGRRFQVSIMDGIALYAYVEPSNNNNS